MLIVHGIDEFFNLFTGNTILAPIDENTHIVYDADSSDYTVHVFYNTFNPIEIIISHSELYGAIVYKRSMNTIRVRFPIWNNRTLHIHPFSNHAVTDGLQIFLDGVKSGDDSDSDSNMITTSREVIDGLRYTLSPNIFMFKRFHNMNVIHVPLKFKPVNTVNTVNTIFTVNCIPMPDMILYLIINSHRLVPHINVMIPTYKSIQTGINANEYPLILSVSETFVMKLYAEEFCVPGFIQMHTQFQAPSNYIRTRDEFSYREILTAIEEEINNQLPKVAWILADLFDSNPYAFLNPRSIISDNKLSLKCDKTTIITDHLLRTPAAIHNDTDTIIILTIA